MATTQVLRFAQGRAATDEDKCTVRLARSHYESSGGSLFAALEGLVESEAFVKRTVK